MDNSKVIKTVYKYLHDLFGLSVDDFMSYFRKDGVEGLDAKNLFFRDKVLRLFDDNEITSSDVFFIKDSLTRMVEEKKEAFSGSFLRSNEVSESRALGEVYTTKPLVELAQKLSREVFGEVLKDAIVWDASAGTGNLFEGWGYPEENLFLSTIRPADIEVLKSRYPKATCFEFDFLNGYDYDSIHHPFVDKLPERLKEAILGNKPIVFYMNPPYFVTPETSDMRIMMKSNGFGEASVDIFFQFLYRVVSFIRIFGLTDAHFLTFGPISFFNSVGYTGFLDHFCEFFDFKKGIVFDGSFFEGVSDTSVWAGSVSLWSSGYCNSEDIIIESMSGTPVIEQIRKPVISKWVSSGTVLEPKEYPTGKGKAWEATDIVSVSSDIISYVFNDNFGLKAIRYNGIVSKANISGVIPITYTNYRRALTMFCLKEFFRNEQASFTPLVINQMWYAPDAGLESTDEYRQFENDMVVLALICPFIATSVVSIEGVRLFRNDMFPLSMDVVQKISGGSVADDGFEPYISNIFAEAVIKASPDVASVVGVYLKYMSESYKLREELGYPNLTEYWDSGYIQLRDEMKKHRPEITREYVSAWKSMCPKYVDKIFEYGFVRSRGN